MTTDFIEIIQIINQSREKAIKMINASLIDLYWNVGQHISQKVEQSNWGQSVVKQLAIFIQETEPEIKGFSDKNIWRMKQFYETYKAYPKLSSMLRKITWTHNLIIMSRCKTIKEREFYINLSHQEKYSTRELERQINTGTFERILIGNSKISSTMREYDKNIINTFKDSYIFDFLNLSDNYSETDLQKALIKQLKNFILELGKDFIFINDEYKIQVGNNDFFIDLLFYHRGLQCLVAFELKADKFKPEHLGQLKFYLEALDRDVKKNNENPSIGILLCKDKDNEVVEYALSRSLSPTMISEYQTQLPDKKILQRKLHEIFISYNQKI